MYAWFTSNGFEIFADHSKKLKRVYDKVKFTRNLVLLELKPKHAVALTILHCIHFRLLKFSILIDTQRRSLSLARQSLISATFGAVAIEYGAAPLDNQ